MSKIRRTAWAAVIAAIFIIGCVGTLSGLALIIKAVAELWPSWGVLVLFVMVVWASITAMFYMEGGK